MERAVGPEKRGLFVRTVFPRPSGTRIFSGRGPVAVLRLRTGLL